MRETKKKTVINNRGEKQYVPSTAVRRTTRIQICTKQIKSLSTFVFFFSLNRTRTTHKLLLFFGYCLCAVALTLVMWRMWERKYSVIIQERSRNKKIFKY